MICEHSIKPGSASAETDWIPRLSTKDLCRARRERDGWIPVLSRLGDCPPPKHVLQLQLPDAVSC